MQFYLKSFSTVDDDQLRSDWARLEANGSATVFQTLTYVALVEQAFLQTSHHKSLYLMLYQRETEEPVCLLTLVNRKHLGASIVETLNYDVVDYCGAMLVPSAFPTDQHFEEAAALISEVLSNHDVLLTKNSVAGSPCAKLLWSPRLMGVDPVGDVATIPLSNGGFEAFAKSCRAYKALKRKRRRLAEDFGFTVRRVSDRDEIDRTFDTMVVQRAKRFANLGIIDGLADPRRQSLFRNLAKKLCPRGDALLLTGAIEGNVIATSFACAFQGTLTAQLCSMAQGPWSKHSLGLVMMAHEIEWAHANGLSCYDLGAGEADYKARFAVETRQRMSAWQPLSAKGHLYLAARNAKHLLRRHAKSHLSDHVRSAITSVQSTRSNRIASISAR